MGSVFGKESVLEPAFKTILESPASAQTVYQIREYGTRFVGMLSPFVFNCRDVFF